MGKKNTEYRAMKEIAFEIDPAECGRIAHEIFIKDSGVGRPGKKFERMRKAAFEIRNRIESNVEIRFACRFYDNVKLAGNKAIINDRTFTCSAFEQIEGTAVEGVYIYAVCAGDFAMPDENIMDQVYADIWGTAFTDAVRLLIKRELEKTAKLSDSFGPGFYGMDVSEMALIDELIDFADIGIELRNGTIMVPLKSCAGMFFKVNESYKPLNAACANCRGSHVSCGLCQVNGGEQYV